MTHKYYCYLFEKASHQAPLFSLFLSTIVLSRTTYVPHMCNANYSFNDDPVCASRIQTRTRDCPTGIADSLKSESDGERRVYRFARYGNSRRKFLIRHNAILSNLFDVHK